MYLFNKISIVFTLVFSLLFSAGRAQNASVALETAFKSGDASGISRYFGPSVDITINNATSTYSRAQGELVLKDFFNKNPVEDYDVEHSSTSAGSPTTFTIGRLRTANGKYKVLLWLRPKDGGYILKEIKFEK